MKTTQGMEITITQCTNAPKWETLEQIIREVTANQRGRLVKIDREDGRCDYRAPGVYNIGFQDNNTFLSVRLNVF